MKNDTLLFFTYAFFLCNTPAEKTIESKDATDLYKEVQTGGVKIILLETPKGRFKIWIKRNSNNL